MESVATEPERSDVLIFARIKMIESNIGHHPGTKDPKKTQETKIRFKTMILIVNWMFSFFSNS